MFKKILSGLGMQGVSVETRLHNPKLYAGETLHGEIRFQGGSSDKEINRLNLQLMTLAEVESGDHESNQALILQDWLVNSRFILPANQSHCIPFSLALPLETPITEVACRQNATRVWIQTYMDVDWGLDATDRDYLNILPTPTMQVFLQAMQYCGLVLATVDVEKGQITAPAFRSTLGCYQELEFVSVHHFSGFNEVEVSFVTQATCTHIMLEIDRKFRSDQLLTLTLPNQGLVVEQVAQQIRQILGLG